MSPLHNQGPKAGRIHFFQRAPTITVGQQPHLAMAGVCSGSTSRGSLHVSFQVEFSQLETIQTHSRLSMRDLLWVFFFSLSAMVQSQSAIKSLCRSSSCTQKESGH